MSSSDSYTVGGLLSASTSSLSIELEGREGGGKRRREEEREGERGKENGKKREARRGESREGGRKGKKRERVREESAHAHVGFHKLKQCVVKNHSSKRSTCDRTYLVLARDDALVER